MPSKAKKARGKLKEKEKEKEIKTKAKTKTETKTAKKAKEVKKETVVEEPAKRVDIDTEIYRDLFKFLEEKVSLECFIDLHDKCFGKTDCECQCHTRK